MELSLQTLPLTSFSKSKITIPSLRRFQYFARLDALRLEPAFFTLVSSSFNERTMQWPLLNKKLSCDLISYYASLEKHFKLRTKSNLSITTNPWLSSVDAEWCSKFQNAFERNSSFPFYVKSKEPRDRISLISSALPETAASVAVAATVVGAAATFLVRRTKASEVTEVPSKICEDCGGSGICSECNGEGFVLKKLSDKSAERARMTAKNMATRYTAGLPKKWSYCTKCSSARSCNSCGGRGKLSF